MAATGQLLSVGGVTFGTDPEGFFAYTADGRIAGAEKVLPPTGITSANAHHRVVLDGVQFEMHPKANALPSEVGKGLHECFTSIVAQLKVKEGQFKVDFTQVVKVDETELHSLSEAARKLGCMPSFNFYRKRPIKVPENFPVRSAAGHLHLGLTRPIFAHYDHIDYRVNLVPMLDLFVGIPTVLMDRDPLSRERRRLYGHAGEYRFPVHGLEYRTLSNFWLKDYALFELICGLAYTACCVIGTSTMNPSAIGAFDPERELAAKISLRMVEGAIERNSATMAWKLWEILRGFIAEHVPANMPGFPVHAGNIHQVNNFFKACAQGKLQSFVNPDPVDHWLNLCDTQKSAAWGQPSIKVIKPNATWPEFLRRVSPAFPAKRIIPCKK